MSHDRGCYCGRERYEYEDCTKPDCTRRKRKLIVTIDEKNVEEALEATEEYLKELKKKQKELEKSDPHKIMAIELHNLICDRHSHNGLCYWENEEKQPYKWNGIGHQYWLERVKILAKFLAEKHMTYEQFIESIKLSNEWKGSK